MILAETFCPFGKRRAQSRNNALPRLKLDSMPLPVIEPDGFDAIVARQGARETHGRILTAREQHKRR